jgi:hypothetical protein
MFLILQQQHCYNHSVGTHLPVPLLINSLNHNPPPSILALEIDFAGFLPEGTSIPSS